MHWCVCGNAALEGEERRGVLQPDVYALAASFTQAGAFHLISLIRSQRPVEGAGEGRREGVVEVRGCG